MIYLFFPDGHRSKPVEGYLRNVAASSCVAIQSRMVVFLHRPGKLRTLLGARRNRRGIGKNVLAAAAGGSLDVDDVFFQLSVDPLPFCVRAAKKFGQGEEGSVDPIFFLLLRLARTFRDINGDEAGGCRVVTCLVPGQVLVSGLFGHFALSSHHEGGSDGICGRFPRKNVMALNFYSCY